MRREAHYVWKKHKNGTSPYYTKDDVFGGIQFTNNAQFYKVGDDGTVTEVSWEDLKPKFNANGWEETAE